MNITTYDGPLLPELFNGYNEKLINEADQCTAFDDIIPQFPEGSALFNDDEIEIENRKIVKELKSCLRKCGKRITSQLQVDSICEIYTDNSSDQSEEDLQSTITDDTLAQECVTTDTAAESSTFSVKHRKQMNIDKSNHLKTLCNRIPESICEPAKGHSSLTLFHKRQVDCETPHSLLTNVNIKDLIIMENFKKLNYIDQYNLIQLLPGCDREILTNGLLRTNGNFLKSEHFQNALKQFTFLLKTGSFMPKKSNVTENSLHNDNEILDETAAKSGKQNKCANNRYLSKEYINDLKYQVSLTRPLAYSYKYGRHSMFTSSPRKPNFQHSCVRLFRRRRVHLTQCLHLLRRLSARQFHVADACRNVASMLSRIDSFLADLPTQNSSPRNRCRKDCPATGSSDHGIDCKPRSSTINASVNLLTESHNVKTSVTANTLQPSTRQSCYADIGKPASAAVARSPHSRSSSSSSSAERRRAGPCLAGEDADTLGKGRLREEECQQRSPNTVCSRLKGQSQLTNSTAISPAIAECRNLRVVDDEGKTATTTSGEHSSRCHDDHANAVPPSSIHSSSAQTPGSIDDNVDAALDSSVVAVPVVSGSNPTLTRHSCRSPELRILKKKLKKKNKKSNKQKPTKHNAAITSILNGVPDAGDNQTKVRDLIYWSTPLRCLKSLVDNIDKPRENLCSANALQQARLGLDGFLRGQQDCYNDSEEEDLFDDALSATYDAAPSLTLDADSSTPSQPTMTYDPSTYNSRATGHTEQTETLVTRGTCNSAPFSTVQDDFSTIIDTDSLRYNPVMRNAESIAFYQFGCLIEE